MIVYSVRRVFSVGMGWVLLISLLGLVAAGPVQAQQEPPSLPVCPETSSIYQLFPSPFFDEDQTLFWVHNDYSRVGILRSTDNGASWLEVFSYSQDRLSSRIVQFTIAPVRSGSGLTLYALVQARWFPIWGFQFYFFVSKDSGSTWQEGTSPCSGHECLSHSLQAASRPGVLFQPRIRYPAGPNLPEGVVRSVDYGVTWQQVLGENSIDAVAISPNFDQDETLVAAPSVGDNMSILISRNAGESWLPGGEGLCLYFFPHLAISPNFARDHTVLLHSSYSSLFMSEDGGLTWRAIFPPGGPFCNTLNEYNPQDAVFSPDYPDDPTIYIRVYHGLYASYDAGQSWSLLVSNSSNDLTVRRTPDTRRLPTKSKTDGGIQLAVEEGYRVFLPLAAVQGSGPPYKPHTLFMRAVITGSTINSAYYRSDDGGRTWQCMTTPLVRPRVYLPLLQR